jgi:hypothetical protein
MTEVVEIICKFRTPVENSNVSPRIIQAYRKKSICDIHDLKDQQLTEDIGPRWGCILVAEDYHDPHGDAEQ